MTQWMQQWLRPGRHDAREVRVDLLWLLGLSLAFIATGIGLRDPWPADEPRFALIARDMVASGNWLIPTVGGDVYGDKPPLFFWSIATFLTLTGSLRAAFLLPSVLAGIASVLLLYDLGRRLWSREVGFMAGLMLLLSVQFVWQARQGQIDAFLCFWTTLGLYGLLRHLLLGPAWAWYAIGWAAAGLGIISKGVGFLPLLVLIIPTLLLRGAAWTPRPRLDGGWRWALGPLALLCAVSIWLAPMLLAASDDAQIAAYRDEILFRQTINRYTDAWHHREPFWYFLIEVIPVLWLPLTALTPWLIAHWRAAWRARELRVVVPLLWVVLVVVFFSVSSGKRGVYVLPAVPAFVLVCAPFINTIHERPGARRTLYGLAWFIAGVALAAAVYLALAPGRRQELLDDYAIDGIGPLLTIGVGAAAACLIAKPRNALAAYGGTLLAVLLVVSYWVNPTMNGVRSGAAFVRRVEAASAHIAELGLVSYKEQYLLNLSRPVVNFGHARWREAQQEAADAAAWLALDPRRALLADQHSKDLCFSTADARALGEANRQSWYLISGSPDQRCVLNGNAAAARLYSTPNAMRSRDALSPQGSD